MKSVATMEAAFAASFTKLPPEELEAWLLKNSLSYFAERVLGLEINAHHEEWARIAATREKFCINAPRDHGKSYMFSFAYPIWRAYHGWIPTTKVKKSIPKRPIGYIFSNTQDQAIKLLEMIANEFEENPKLAHLMPAKKETWSKSEIKLANGAVIRARGWGTSVRGAHPVWLVVDDGLNDEAVYSEMARKKQIDYFQGALTPMVIPGGQIAVIGTPFHQMDLYQALAKNEAYFFRKFPAINPSGEALWPTRYTKEDLLKRKIEVGSTTFSREYLCEAISDDSSIFPQRLIDSCLAHEWELPTFLTEAEKKELRIFTGVDLAISSTVGADYTVITTLGVNNHGESIILDIRRRKGLTMTAQLAEIQDVYRTYRPTCVLIENNGFQRIFQDTLVQNTSIPVRGHTTTAHSKNAADGILSLQILFENNKIFIPRGTDRCKRLTDPLIEELKNFTYVNGKLQGLGAHDDCVMSLWLAHKCAQSYDVDVDTFV